MLRCFIVMFRQEEWTNEISVEFKIFKIENVHVFYWKIREKFVEKKCGVLSMHGKEY